MVRIMGIVLNVRCIMVLDRGTHSIQDSQDSANGHGGDEARRRWNGRLSPHPLAVCDEPFFLKKFPVAEYLLVYYDS